MDNIDAIKEVLHRARQKRADLVNQLRSIESVIQYLEAELGMPVSTTQGKVISVVDNTIKYRGLSAPKAAEEVLRECGKPLHINEIMDKMYGGGFVGQLEKDKLYSNLYSVMLKRKSHIFNKIPKKPATFGLVEWEKQKEMEIKD